MNVGEVRVSVLSEWLQSLPWAVFIHKTPWAFTTIEVVHVFAVSMVLGTIALVDLRLLGLAWTKRPFAEFRLHPADGITRCSEQAFRRSGAWKNAMPHFHF